MTTIEIQVPELPKNKKIHSIMAQSLESLACLFHDCEGDINSALTEGGENVTISHSIIISLGKNKQTDKLHVSIKKGDEITVSLSDPDQGEMFERNGEPRKVTPKNEAALPALPAPAACIETGVIDAEIVPDAEEDKQDAKSEEE